MCAEKDINAPRTAGCLQIHHNIKASAKKWGFRFHSKEAEKALKIDMVLRNLLPYITRLLINGLQV